jgi:hypothetical protein
MNGEHYTGPRIEGSSNPRDNDFRMYSTHAADFVRLLMPQLSKRDTLTDGSFQQAISEFSETQQGKLKLINNRENMPGISINPEFLLQMVNSEDLRIAGGTIALLGMEIGTFATHFQLLDATLKDTLRKYQSVSEEGLQGKAAILLKNFTEELKEILPKARLAVRVKELLPNIRLKDRAIGALQSENLTPNQIAVLTDQANIDELPVEDILFLRKASEGQKASSTAYKAESILTKNLSELAGNVVALAETFKHPGLGYSKKEAVIIELDQIREILTKVA